MKLRILMILLIMPITYGIVPVEEHNGIGFKFYSTINKTACFELFDSIPSEYSLGLKYIRVFGMNRYYGGMYWRGTSMIDLFSCNLDVLKHELAHHCQAKLGDTTDMLLRHKGNFNRCYPVWRVDLEDVLNSDKQSSLGYILVTP